MNMGNAPVGSIGKPIRGEWKLVDEKGKEVPPGEIGEMINKVEEGAIRTVEYYKNGDASEKKSKAGGFVPVICFLPIRRAIFILLTGPAIPCAAGGKTSLLSKWKALLKNTWM